MEMDQNSIEGKNDPAATSAALKGSSAQIWAVPEMQLGIREMPHKPRLVTGGQSWLFLCKQHLKGQIRAGRIEEQAGSFCFTCKVAFVPPDTQRSLLRLWEMSWENTRANLLWFKCLRQASHAESKSKPFTLLLPRPETAAQCSIQQGIYCGAGKHSVSARNQA